MKEAPQTSSPHLFGCFRWGQGTETKRQRRSSCAFLILCLSLCTFILWSSNCFILASTWWFFEIKWLKATTEIFVCHFKIRLKTDPGVRAYCLEKLWTGTVYVWVKGINFRFTQNNCCCSGPEQLQSGVRGCTAITMRFGSWKWSPVNQSCPGLCPCLFKCARCETKTVQSRSECASKMKTKVTFYTALIEQGSFWESCVIKTWKGEFQALVNGVETSCFVKSDIFHFEVHGNVSTGTIDKTALNMQIHNHFGIQIPCGTGKSVERVCRLSIKSHCLHFYPQKPLMLRWPKSHFFLTEVSVRVEILHFWREMVARATAGPKLVLNGPCCSPAFGISEILAFSRSSSFFRSRFLLFRRKSTWKLFFYCLVFFSTRRTSQFGFDQCQWRVTAVQILFKKQPLTR